jgi:hypothetical protein
MPFLLIIAGVVMVTAGVRGTYPALFKLLKGDFTGPNNFVYWMLAILILGSLGYIDELRPFSRAFMVLVIVVLVLKSGNPQNAGGGFFASFTQQLSATAPTSQATVPINP